MINKQTKAVNDSIAYTAVGQLPLSGIDRRQALLEEVLDVVVDYNNRQLHGVTTSLPLREI